MKKVIIVSVMVLVVGMAYASSIAIPWFVDNAAPGAGSPPSAGVMTLIYLKSNVVDDLTCEITYYSATGIDLGPVSPDNQFLIPALSSVAFRPVQDDPSSVPGGQESAVAVLIPNRPTDVDPKKNGSASISWVGEATDVQGIAVQMGNVGGKTFSFGHLLPPGA
ncbi:MAG: hypothetical protein KAH38_13110 [Candidatus Hydrogenedentes bacterium]|nr:hypothetical protein [Candidatus Hydrogenedentota bacterium]